uniref:PPE family protein n=1 Tax=Rhabditophanes sp. KR3021 TaxID=114890 RepID=A0AC35TH66_9BILA
MQIYLTRVIFISNLVSVFAQSWGYNDMYGGSSGMGMGNFGNYFNSYNNPYMMGSGSGFGMNNFMGNNMNSMNAMGMNSMGSGGMNSMGGGGMNYLSGMGGMNSMGMSNGMNSMNSMGGINNMLMPYNDFGMNQGSNYQMLPTTQSAVSSNTGASVNYGSAGYRNSNYPSSKISKYLKMKGATTFNNENCNPLLGCIPNQWNTKV